MILSTLWRRRYWVLLAVVAAVGVGIVTTHRVSLSPPSLETKAFTTGSATTQVLLDSPRSSLTTLDEDIGRLSTRAALFATFMRNGTLIEAIARRANLPVERLTSDGPYVGPGQPNAEVGAEERANQLVSEGKLYRLRYDAGRSDSPLPIVAIYAQAPNSEQAVRLADAAAKELQAYVERAGRESGAPSSARLIVSQLTPAVGGEIATGVATKAAVLTAVGLLGALLLAIVIISGLVESWRIERRMRSMIERPWPAPANVGQPAPAGVNGNGGTGPSADAPQETTHS